MGAPKQKWTPEEEAALKAGVLKHGTGKWRTILSDPQFSSVLKSRSNVDLKVIKTLYRLNVLSFVGYRYLLCLSFVIAMFRISLLIL